MSRLFRIGALACALTVPAAAPALAESGIMSHYSALGTTASGRSYSSSDYVAAHKTLPLGTMVRVENLRNGRSTTVKIVDRGPYVAGRIIDVSVGVARDLGFAGQGLAPTRITVLGRGSSAGPYDRGGRATASYDDDDTPKRRKGRTIKVAASDDDDAPKRSAKSRKVRVASLDDGDQPRRKRASRRVQKEEDDD